MSTDDQSPKIEELEAKLTEQADRIAELSRENTKWRRQAQGKDLSPEAQERIAQLESENEQLKAGKTASEKAVKAATTEAEKARKALESAEGFTRQLLVDNGLTDALAKAGVTNPVHLKAVKSMLSGQVQIVADGDNKVAKVGDKPLADFVTEWAKGDEGKHFVAAPANGGGGSQGGGGAPAGKTMTRSQFDAADQPTRATFAKSGGQVVDG